MDNCPVCDAPIDLDGCEDCSDPQDHCAACADE